MSNILSVTSMRKAYGDLVAVDNVSFGVGRNEIVGLLGPNGAGKTSTINMILGVLEPDAGEILIQGIDISRQRSEAMSRASFAAVYTPLPGNLTVAQNLHIFGLLYKVKDLSVRIQELLKEYDLVALKDKKSGVLSSGEQTRLSLAKAMLNRPEILLLDEPTASLDPSVARDIRQKILTYAKEEGGSVLWTSHNMYEVQDVCDRVLFMSHGRILLEGNPKTLPAEHGKKTLEDLFIAIAKETLTLREG